MRTTTIDAVIQTATKTKSVGNLVQLASEIEADKISHTATCAHVQMLKLHEQGKRRKYQRCLIFMLALTCRNVLEIEGITGGVDFLI